MFNKRPPINPQNSAFMVSSQLATLLRANISHPELLKLRFILDAENKADNAAIRKNKIWLFTQRIYIYICLFFYSIQKPPFSTAPLSNNRAQPKAVSFLASYNFFLLFFPDCIAILHVTPSLIRHAVCVFLRVYFVLDCLSIFLSFYLCLCVFVCVNCIEKFSFAFCLTREWQHCRPPSASATAFYAIVIIWIGGKIYILFELLKVKREHCACTINGGWHTHAHTHTPMPMPLSSSPPPMTMSWSMFYVNHSSQTESVRQ